MKIFNSLLDKDFYEEFNYDDYEDLTNDGLKNFFGKNNDLDYFQDVVDDWFDSTRYN